MHNILNSFCKWWYHGSDNFKNLAQGYRAGKQKNLDSYKDLFTLEPMFLTDIHYSRVTNSEALTGNVNLCSDSYIQCLVIIYTWVSNRHLRLHMAKTESFIFPTKCVPPSVLQFPISINDTHLPSYLSQTPGNWPWSLSFPHLMHPTHQQGLRLYFQYLSHICIVCSHSQFQLSFQTTIICNLDFFFQ